MSEIQVNTINEYTSANGVTIDGVLIKDGNVDGVDVSGITSANLVKLQTYNTTGATYTFDDVFDASTYSSYLIDLQAVKPGNDNVALRYNFRQGGASGSDITGGYYLTGNYFLSTNSTQNDMKQSSTDYATLASTLGTATFEAISTTITFSTDTDGWSMLSSNFQMRRSDSLDIQYDHISGKLTGTTITGIKFYMSSGNMQGTITIYGVKK